MDCSDKEITSSSQSSLPNEEEEQEDEEFGTKVTKTRKKQKKSAKVFKCNLCPKEFAYETSHDKHIKNVHEDTSRR
jgi:hypothetical protein